MTMGLVKIELGADAMPVGSPLKNVSKYSCDDVLCGRWRGMVQHRGNCQ